MKKLFAWIAFILGIWLMVSPWLLNYMIGMAQWHDSLAGLVIIGFALAFILSKAKPALNWPHLMNSIIGLWLCVSGILVFGQTSITARWNEIVVGILIALFSAVATQVIEGKKAFVYTKEGGVLVEMTKMSYNDGIIVMKGKAFGAMPQVMHVKPDEIWNLLGIVPFEVIIQLPKLLYLGWKMSKEAVAVKDSN